MTAAESQCSSRYTLTAAEKSNRSDSIKSWQHQKLAAAEAGNSRSWQQQKLATAEVGTIRHKNQIKSKYIYSD
jgi:hypothetical protein